MLRWAETGRGAPPVILLAGRNDVALSWGPVLAALGGRVRAVAYDRAGLGDSDPDPGPPTAGRAAQDLAALVAIVGGPCVLAGHSWGGLLALMLAECRPELIAGLVLVDPAMPDLLSPMPRMLRRAYGAAARAMPITLQAAGLLRPLTLRAARRAAPAFSDDPGVRVVVVQAYLACARWQHVRAGLREGRGIRAGEAVIRRAAAGSGVAGAPMVIISATEGAPARVRRHWTAQQAYLTARCGARHVLAEGSGHAVHQQRAGLVAAAILDVVAACPR